MNQTRTAVITGSTSGIGTGIARALAGAGCNVVINGFGKQDEIEKVRSGLEEEFSITARFDGSDMTKPDEIEKMILNAENEFGSVDIIVNNAGIQFVAPVDKFPVEKWDAIISINLSAAFHMIRIATPIMKRTGWGRIINIASAHALVASPFKSAYVAAKHGLAGLTKTVALELAEQNITCNAVCPGYVKTPLVEGQIASQARERGITEEQVVRDVLLGAQPTKQFTTVEDLGALVAFLASDAAKNITGAVIPADGGWTAH
jgi:3-hydroxybutyrate dehydrogenase